jgi:transposase
MPTKLSTIEIDMNQLDDILRRIDANELTEGDCETLRTLCKAYVQLTELLKDKNTSLARLRKLLFGSQTEKTKAMLGDGKDSQPRSPQAATALASATDLDVSTNVAEAEKSPRPGHGRNGAHAYSGAEKIVVPHESLQPGDACPRCGKGTVYQTGRPGVLVRLVGQAPIQAKVYELQKLRCNLCGEVFTAAAPQGVGSQKYDATSGSMIALLKYGSGMPFNRNEGLQGSLGVPLPASTQWEIVCAKAEKIAPAYEELICQAAQGEVLYNDDTTVKILEFMGARA